VLLWFVCNLGLKSLIVGLYYNEIGRNRKKIPNGFRHFSVNLPGWNGGAGGRGPPAGVLGAGSP
jgi:hypothetical protein